MKNCPSRRLANRVRLAVESLEQRDVPSALSVSDVTVREGPANLGVLDPSGAASVGLSGIRELTFGSNGDLFVTGWISQSVARFDWASQTYKPFIAPGSGGMTDVQGISIGPDGNVYVSSPTQNTVFRFDGLTGAPFPAPGRTGAIFIADDPNTVGVDESGGLADARGVTFGADGNLYVCSRNTNQILRYQGPAGSSPGAFIGVFATITDATWPHDLAFGPYGNLYVSCINGGVSDYGQINRYDGLTGSPIGTGVFVARGSGGLLQARQFVFDQTGANLYVNESSGGTVQLMRYQGPNGQNPGAFVETYITAGQVGLDAGVGVARDSAGNFYMGNKDGAVVRCFAPSAQASFTVTLNSASASLVSVHYATTNGAAIAGTDYTQTSGTLVFPAGDTTETVSVPITTVATGGPTKTFTLNLSAPVNATIADGVGVGSILNRQTKFFVVDGGNVKTYQYGSGGTSEEFTPQFATDVAPRGVATTAAGTTVWVEEANRNVYVYTNHGVFLGSWTAGSLSSNAQVTGIATNGTDVWLVDSSADKVYKYAGAASRLSGSQNAASSFNLVNGKNGNSNPQDIVTDGASFWVVDGTAHRVFKYTLSGSSLGSWTIDAANAHPTGVTIDPTNVSDVWIVDNVSLKVYQYVGAASRISGSQNAATTFALNPYDTNPQGIADPPPPDTALTAVGTPAVSPSSSLSGRNAIWAVLGGATPSAPFAPFSDPVKGGNITVQSVDRSLPADNEFALSSTGGYWNQSDRLTPLTPVVIDGASSDPRDSDTLGDGVSNVNWLASADAFLALLSTDPARAN